MIYRTLIGFAFSAAVFVSIVEGTALQKFTVQNAATRQAVCNDGSPAIYYYRKGSGQGLNTWVIFLGGGGFCYSVTSCNTRQVNSPELMTSTDKPSLLNGDGILSDSSLQNPDFFNANHVAIPYCSSDLWSGNREASQGTGGYEFRGRRILRAVVADLKKKTGSGSLSSANRVLLSGTSAGGVGVMVHLDWLAAQLPATQVHGINDAGWTPDVLSLIDTSQLQKIDTALSLWNGKVDSSCARSNADAKFRCYTSAVYTHLSAPLFVQMSQYDTVFLSSVAVRPPFNSSEAFIANLFASAIRDSFEIISAGFSPRKHTHGLLPSNKFSTVEVNNHSLRELLGNWFFERPGPVKVVKQ